MSAKHVRGAAEVIDMRRSEKLSGGIIRRPLTAHAAVMARADRLGVGVQVCRPGDGLGARYSLSSHWATFRGVSEFAAFLEGVEWAREQAAKGGAT